MTERKKAGAAQLLSDISSLGIFGLMGLVGISVFFRYVLNAPILATEDLTALLLGLTIFTALPSVTLNRGHISVGLFLSLFKNRPGFDRLRRTLIDIGMVLMMFYMGWVVLLQAYRQFTRGTETAAMEWSVWPSTTAFACLIFVGAATFARRIRRDEGNTF